MTDEDLQLMTFERQNPGLSLAKDLEIWGEFGMSATSYYERLERLIDDAEAYEVDSGLMQRLLRQRNVRRVFGLLEETY